MQQILDHLTGAQARSVIKSLEEPFSKLPHLPKNIQSFIVTIAPWVNLLAIVMYVLAIVALLPLIMGATAVLGAAGYLYSPVMALVGLIIMAVEVVLLVMAFKPLRARHINGWYLMFWVNVLGIIWSVVNLQLVGAVLSALIGFYILFEIKSHYSSTAKTE